MFQLFSQYVSRKSAFFLAADAIMIVFALVAGTKLRYLSDPQAFAYYTELPDFGYRVLIVVAVFLVSGYYNELYTTMLNHGVGEQFFRLTQSLGIGCFLLAALYFVFPTLQMGRLAFALGLLLMLLFVMGSRWATDQAWRNALPKENILILGATDLAADIAREISFRSDLNLRVTGFVRPSDRSDEEHSKVFGRQILGAIEDLEDIVQSYSISKVIVALDERRGVLPMQKLLRLRTRGIQVEDARSTLTALTGRIQLDSMRSSWFIFSEGFRRTRYSMAVKRTIDLILSITGLILCLPVMLLTAIVVRLDSPGPILYRQTRTGLNGRPFELLKFRTMRQDAESDGVARWSVENDPRITRTGGFMRKYRFDELPQFVNVIRGDMSFVGPRPERPEFVDQLAQKIPYYEERHTKRPGITGWAQVCFPYGSTVEDALRKFEYDLFYLKNVSILFDVAIVFQTVKIVLWGRGR